ncbi:MAG TPA: serine hydrolase domain-containing protein, partial [Fibrobacteria bacterium]|nr:serine hydrolase domain-containing protein [Fibrobacteria bacterium]
QEGSVGRWSLHPSLEGGAGLASLGIEAAKGLHPVLISGPPERDGAALAGNPLGTPRARGFTVLAAERARPAPKEWTVTGQAAPSLGAFDDYMRGLMQQHQVRAGALAMVKDGRLVLARGYTWAEAGYPVTQPNSLFRVASCSKPLTSMAVHKMLREGGQAEGPLSLKEKVIALLSLPAGGAPRDARFADITLDDLLSHSAGWIRSKENPDPVFNDYPPGHAIRRRLPSSPDAFLDYMLGQPLQFSPGSQSSYANFGYFLLGRILGNLPHGRGRGYEQAIGELVFRPLGLTRPRIGGSYVGERLPDEVMYHSRYPYLQRGHQEGGPAWVPGGYGDFDIKNMEAAGAWLLAATDYAKVLASFDREDNPVMGAEAIRTMWAPHRDPRFLRGWFATRVRRQDGDTLTAKWHNGLFPGTSTLVFYRPDKWSFALFLNRDIASQLTGDVHGRELGRLADRVKTWPTDDLFPAVGIEPFTVAREADPSKL